MSAPRPDAERVWLQAQLAALSGLVASDPPHEAPVNWRDIDRRLVSHASDIADAAVLEWRKRYPS